MPALQNITNFDFLTEPSDMLKITEQRVGEKEKEICKMTTKERIERERQCKSLKVQNDTSGATNGNNVCTYVVPRNYRW